MKPLHTFQDLQTDDPGKIEALMREYLALGDRFPEKVKRFSYRDRFFFFAALHQQLLVTEPDNAISLLQCKEAAEYNFLFIHNMYKWDLNFCHSHTHPITHRPITAEYQDQLHEWYDEQLTEWINQVNQASDIYTAEIKREISVKRKQFAEQLSAVNLSAPTLDDFDRLVYSRAFAIYHVCKLIFDSSGTNFEAFTSGGIKFVITVKTIVHFLFRHYIPSMDLIQESRSINTEVSGFDILNPIESFKALVDQYINRIHPTFTNPGEHWLFGLDNVRYILWLRKLKSGHPAAKDGDAYEIASFYRCEAPDLTKFEGRNEICIADHRTAYL